MARVFQLMCGRWAIAGQKITLPTKALAQDYARAVARGRRCMWCRRAAVMVVGLSVVFSSLDELVNFAEHTASHAALGGVACGVLGLVLRTVATHGE